MSTSRRRPNNRFPRFDDAEVLGIAQENGIALTWWQVMDAGHDSVDLLQNGFDQFGGKLRS